MGQPLAQFQAPAPTAVNMNHPLLSQMQVRQVYLRHEERLCTLRLMEYIVEH